MKNPAITVRKMAEPVIEAHAILDYLLAAEQPHPVVATGQDFETGPWKIESIGDAKPCVMKAAH